MATLKLHQALYEFGTALQQGTRRRLLRLVTGGRNDIPTLAEELVYYEGNRSIDRGLQTICVGDIVGSAGGNKHFDRDFLPLNRVIEQRWARIYAMFIAGHDLPPIEVVLLGDAYYVVDGHHRVSVARHLGQYYIEAYVIEQGGSPATC